MKEVNRVDIRNKIYTTSNTFEVIEGSGKVDVQQIANKIQTTETVMISNSRGDSFLGKNIYSWTFHQEHINLSHNRTRNNKSIFLLKIKSNRGSLQKQALHYCNLDIYNLTLDISSDSFNLLWSVIGPEKKQYLSSKYFIGKIR